MYCCPQFIARNIEWHFQFAIVDILLSDIIDRFKKLVDDEVFDNDAFINSSIKSRLHERATDLFIIWSRSNRLFNIFLKFIYEVNENWNTFPISNFPNFIEEILRLVYRVEDITSSFLCKREMGKKMVREQSLMMTKMVMSSFPVFFNTLIDQRVLYNEMQKVELDFIACLHQHHPLLQKLSLQYVKGYLFGYNDNPWKHIETSWDDIDISESVAVGFEEEQERLFQEIYHGQQSYIKILGRASCGKTSVARNVYKKVVAARDFEMCVWVTVSPNYNIRDVCAAILSKTESTRKDMFSFNVLRTRPSESLFESVSKKLGSGKFIIVLDDVHYIWSDIESKMERLFPIIPDLGSKVVFITHEHDARVAEHTTVIKLNGLSDEGSWALFCYSIGNSITNSEFLIRGTIREICTGLPMEVITLASLFITKKTSHFKLSKDNEGFHENSSSKSSSFISWDLQYLMLPPTTRLCCLYMALFPKAFWIPIRRLIRLWIAEGLIIKSDISSFNTLEDVALNNLMQLQTRQMVEVREKNGRPKTCQIPEDKHEFLCEKAKDIGIFHVHDSGNSRLRKFNVGRLAGHVDIESYPTLDPYIQHLHSYVSFDTRKRDTTQQQIGVFLDRLTAQQGFGLLRVLDLEGVYKPLLTAETLGKLFLLTYLGLRWTLLDSLPDSVGGLQYLEALDVKHTNITSLPSAIWKAKNLRHLYMNQVYFDMSFKRSFTARLTKLQTLWGLSIGSNSLVVNWLSQLIELRKLGLTYHPTTAQAIANWVAKLTHLQSLRLRSIDEFGEPSVLMLPDMSALDNLSDLYLVGELRVLNSVEAHDFQFPSNLKILTLTGSKLVRNDSLRMLGKLNQLNTLRFYGHSYWGDELIFYNNEFPKLVVLKLWMLENLNKLELQEGALSNLKEIDIRLCHNLKNVNGLEQRSRPMRKMTLTNMPVDFVQNVTSVVDKDVVVEVKELNFSSI